VLLMRGVNDLGNLASYRRFIGEIVSRGCVKQIEAEWTLLQAPPGQRTWRP
jgi:hypothetical protein